MERREASNSKPSKVSTSIVRSEICFHPPRSPFRRVSPVSHCLSLSSWLSHSVTPQRVTRTAPLAPLITGLASPARSGLSTGENDCTRCGLAPLPRRAACGENDSPRLQQVGDGKGGLAAIAADRGDCGNEIAEGKTGTMGGFQGFVHAR